MNCPDCDQPMLPDGMVKKQDEYDHASGCPSSPTPPSTPHSAKSVPEEWMKSAARELEKRFKASSRGGGWPQVNEVMAIIARHSPGWVKIEEGKPETLPEFGNGLVLCVISREPDEQPLRDIGWHDDSGWHTRSKLVSVTHWMPLPAPPSEGETKK